ncbi:hypothetical protein Pmi06nite_06540 [Planotetraspora mira]|uniref:Uncharacterized protein n=1 Tax=Planotetraspora mira TaxID=58121 RepID=A0A8J3TK75_9ACTN|nr:hypothetical protein Pmi06nite_06540 [Planotetraspora mira]
MSDFSPPPRTGHPQRPRTALALMGVMSVVGLAGLGIVLALSSNGDVAHEPATPSAAPASFIVQAPTTPPETIPENPEATWAPGVVAGEAPGAQGAGEVPPDTISPTDPAEQPGAPETRPGTPPKHPDRRNPGHPGRNELPTSPAPRPVLPPRMPVEKPAPAAPAARAPREVTPAQAPPGAARSAAPQPGPNPDRPGPAPVQPGPNLVQPGPTPVQPGPNPVQPGPTALAPRPGPSRLPDPCATYHDARRDYCYRVVADLTAGG